MDQSTSNPPPTPTVGLTNKTKRESEADRQRKNKLSAAIEGYLYLAPTLIALTIFVFIPVVQSFQLSLTRSSFGRSIDVGFDNYVRLFNDDRYHDVIWTTLKFTMGTVPIGIALAVVLAIALSYPLKHLSWFYRLLIFVPIVISTAVTGVLFKWIYHPTVGYLNHLLGFFGIDGPTWLTQGDWPLVSIIIAVVWRQIGFNTIIALAGIQNIDGTLYEAAKVDGANLWHRIRHITLPLLSPTLFFLLIINVIGSLQVFGEIDILTNGSISTRTMLYSIYFEAFRSQNNGGASAQAFILFLLIVGLSFMQFVVVGKKVHYQ
ncbi:MAG: sugar ABC transporter permease [Anaerolineae bacterium]|nr:sugar ABC transporter permease [Anaerolineae bacterium]MDQ7034896.1 sugar ABC transporter permease [Anaerolineae bacterium]